MDREPASADPMTPTEQSDQTHVKQSTPPTKIRRLIFVSLSVLVIALILGTSTKVFFMGLVSASDRLVIVRQIISELENTVREYEDTQSEYSEKVFPEQIRNIAKYQLKTLDLGIIQQAQTLAWFRKMEKEIKVEIRG